MRPQFHRAAGCLVITAASLFVLSCSGREQQVAPTPTPSSVVVSCETISLGTIGQQARCQARVTLSDGTTQDGTNAAQWSSSDPSKVSVNASGVISAVAIGSADISASVSGVVGRQAVSVAIACTFSVSPTVLTFPFSGGSQTVALAATPNGCSPSAWTATTSNAALTASPASGTGSGPITITAAANSGPAQTFTATVAGQTVTAAIAAAPPPPKPTHVLSVTLTQGEQLSGPYAGTVTGPGGFECTLLGASISCPPVRFDEGQTVTLVVTLTVGQPGDRPIRSAAGCDTLTPNTCTVVMNADRHVTISIGCAICLEPAASASLAVRSRRDSVPRGVLPRDQLVDRD